MLKERRAQDTMEHIEEASNINLGEGKLSQLRLKGWEEVSQAKQGSVSLIKEEWILQMPKGKKTGKGK